MVLNEQTYKIKDISLADEGRKILEDMCLRMPVVSIFSDRFDYQKPFNNLKILVCSHVTKETAVTCIALKKGGANLLVIASESVSTDDRISAALVKYYGIRTYAETNASNDDLNGYREAAYHFAPDLIVDDGAEILSNFYEHHMELTKNLIASLEQTTSGVFKVKKLDEIGMLNHPVICINSSKVKYLFDNYYGVGQSVVTAITFCTKKLMAGLHVVVVGYGNVGAGVSAYMRGVCANVIVCEKDPLKALKAHMDGFNVMNLDEAVEYGDIYITVTGSADVISEETILKLKSGAVLSNCGSGNKEISVEALEKHTIRKERVSEYITRYFLDNGKNIDLLAEGRVTNFIVSGCPAEIMDMTFSAVLLGVEYAVENKGNLPHHALVLSQKFDEAIAYIKLNEYGIKLNIPTEKQKEYDKSWKK